MSFAELKDAAAKVAGGVSQVDRAGWRALSSIHWRVDRQVLARLALLSRADVVELTRLIDNGLILTRAGLATRRLNERTLLQRVWDAGSQDVNAAKRSLRNIQGIYDVAGDVRSPLGLVRRYLVDCQANVATLQSEDDALSTKDGLQPLSVDDELKSSDISLGSSNESSVSEPITLELAAHRVKHTAVTSLDVFESFARGMQASLADRVSYIDLWAMSDAVSIMDDVPDGPRLAASLTELKDVVMKVEDGVSEINRVGWHAFSSIDRWIVRLRDAIIAMRAAGRPDERELHKLLAQLSSSSRANVDELIRLIDKTLLLTHAGLGTASDVRRYALAAGADIQRRLAERSLPQRVWEAGSHAVKVSKRNVRSIQHIYDATNDVQAQLGMVRRYLVDYQANAANFHSEINAMEILTLEQELRELEHIGRKIEHVLQEAKRVNRDAFEKSARSLDT
ncbi:hypothetical protein AURDEDRAFT_179651 [Auricularia subglabra TFB-10046 SS5]|nr:hypothetical protein AURDEDRAFT_179651 [Auricularia subglabra TFB-10046 SS5]